MRPIRLSIGGYGPQDSSHGAGLAAFRDHLERSANGEVVVDVVWNIMDQGRPNTDLLDLVESNDMFMCYFSTSYVGPRVRELNILETPFLFPDLQSAHRSLDGALGEHLRASIRARTVFETLGFWDNGFRHLTNHLRPVRAPEDCRGMSVRIQPNPIHEELVRSWGGVPVAVELGEGIKLIESRSVDAQENPLANTVAYGVDRIHPYVTMTGHLYGARGLFANRATYEGLSTDLRDLIDDAAALAVALQRKTADESETKLRRVMEANGIEFVDLGPDERELFVTAASAAIAMAHDSFPADLMGLVT